MLIKNKNILFTLAIIFVIVSCNKWEVSDFKRKYEFSQVCALKNDIYTDSYSDILILLDQSIYLYSGFDVFNAQDRTPVLSLYSPYSDFSISDVSPMGDFLGNGTENIIIPNEKSESSKNKVYLLNLNTNVCYRWPIWDSNMVFLDNNDTLTSSFGSNAISLGDINGDGKDDLAIGSESFSEYDPNTGDTNYSIGGLYIYFGNKNLGLQTTTEMASVSIKGSKMFDEVGSNISAIGDINNDSWNDFSINNITRNDSGIVFIFFGNPSLGGSKKISEADLMISGEVNDLGFGDNVHGINDFNGDGIDDILVTSRTAGISAKKRGAVFIFFGKNTFPGSLTFADADITILPQDQSQDNELIGIYSAPLGDLNGDGFSDFMISQRTDDSSTQIQSQHLLIFFGSDTLSGNISSTNAAGKIIFPDSRYAICLAKNTGDINNDGFSDILLYNPYETQYISQLHIFLGSSSFFSSNSTFKNLYESDHNILFSPSENNCNISWK